MALTNSLQIRRHHTLWCKVSHQSAREQLQSPKPAAYGIRCMRVQLQRLAGNGSSATDTLNTNGWTVVLMVGWVKPQAFYSVPAAH